MFTMRLVFSYDGCQRVRKNSLMSNYPPYFSCFVVLTMGFTLVEGSYRRELNSRLVQDWQSYSPSEVLDQFGTPSFIELTEVENSPYYRLGLSYESLGIEISYIVPFKVLENGKIEMCFNLQSVDFIGLSLYSPDKAKDVPVGIIPNRLDSYTSWETTTGLDKEDFQQLLENNGSQPCIEVD